MPGRVRWLVCTACCRSIVLAGLGCLETASPPGSYWAVSTSKTSRLALREGRWSMRTLTTLLNNLPKLSTSISYAKSQSLQPEEGLTMVRVVHLMFVHHSCGSGDTVWHSAISVLRRLETTHSRASSTRNGSLADL